jgi:hypothetical protein
MDIRITDIPPGEAPESVRKGWVGLVLPLARGETGPRRLLTSGVLTGPRSRFARLWHLVTGRLSYVEGYVVDAPRALSILSDHVPEAAEWWERNTPYLQEGRKFMFHAEVCEEIDA